MASWLAVLALPAFFQENVEELKKEIERLRQENQTLQERTIEDARTIQRLKQAIKHLESLPLSGPPPVQPPLPGAAGDEILPKNLVRGKVTAIMAKQGWILIDLGKAHGVKPGWKFDINHMVYDTPASPPRPVRAGGGEFVKFMEKEEMSQVRITEGNIADVKLDDEVVAVRALPPLTPAERARPPEGPKPGVFKITGRTGSEKDGIGFVLNYGSAQGAMQSKLVYAYRDGKFKAKLRLDTVKETFSVASVVDQAAPVEDVDQIYTAELKKGLTGRISMVDDKRGIAVDVKAKEGARVGQRFEVRRQGQRVGTIILSDVQSWGAWARPEGETRLDQVQRNDFVELIDDGP